MKPEDLTALLAVGATDDPGRSSDCPDELEIAGYVDGGLSDPARRRIEEHLADCSHCLAVVGLLCRERHDDATEQVDKEPAAKSLATVTRAQPRRSWAPPRWAAAAAIVLAVPLLYQFGRSLDDGPEEGQGRPAPAATRTLATSAAGLQVLSPGAGASVDARSLSFHWTEVSGTPYYDVRIVTDAGDVVVQQRVTGTTWQPPARLNLKRGAEYFVHIDAYPSGDKAVSSDHVPFRVSD